MVCIRSENRTVGLGFALLTYAVNSYIILSILLAILIEEVGIGLSAFCILTVSLLNYFPLIHFLKGVAQLRFQERV